ncbi:MAG: DUF2161 family putative PD-(D/E)XK-type phosphodiesterase [Pseudomonadaceae bacterium]|nr:DUF2161 family putative PD-(D/E)XK-type phosphodiesterase [Pseudomonadaceae bacterium]
MKESDLYPPIKAFLVAQGYEVKSEVAGVDIVACRDDEDPVLVEMKTGLTLALVHQGIARQSISDWVYLAVPQVRSRKALAANLRLCRRLGLGLIMVRLSDSHVTVSVDPKPYKPRKVKARRGRLLNEFARRVGDPNTGGTNRVKLVTAYRQDALRCASFLSEHGDSKGADVAKGAAVAGATNLMRSNHYGWFERVGRGVYALTTDGAKDLERYGKESPIELAVELADELAIEPGAD